MGASVSTRVTDAIDTIGAYYVAVIVGLIYLALSGFCITSIVMLISQSTSSGPKDLAFASALVGSVMHWLLQFAALSFIFGHRLHSVPPKWVFVLLDNLQSVMLGITIASYIIVSAHVDASSGDASAIQAQRDAMAPWLIAANGILVLCEWGYVYKAYVIVQDIRRGKRDTTTGQLLSSDTEYEDDYYE